MPGNQVNEESFNLSHLELHCFRCKLISFQNAANLNFAFSFFFEIMKNENRKSKIRQVLFLFNLLTASADTPIPTE